VSLRFLVDTNTVSEAMKLQPNSSVIQKLDTHASEIAISAITWHELRFGCYCLPMSRRRQKIEQYLTEAILQNVPILFYDTKAAEWFAQERARLSAIGKTPAYADGQIAAVAQVNNLIVVTRNVKDYSDFQNLQIEDWFS
jgi:tRNA(fMet)-specific endonuclease VapC